MTAFKPNPKAIRLDKTVDGTLTSEYIAPAIRVKLDNDFWTQTIIEKEGESVLSDSKRFNEYFRSLHIKAEAITANGSMVLLNLAAQDANITIYYTKGETDARTQSSYTLNFRTVRLNTFINDYNSTYLSGINNPNTADGDEKLYLKGMEGSMAIVDLFGGDETKIKAFKDFYRIPDSNSSRGYKEDENGNFILKRLINEAQLVIYEDKNANNGGDPDLHKFDRIYAYDVKNSIPIVDYLTDPTENTQLPFNSRVIHLGQRLKVGDDYKYKIRLTEHLKSILLRDSTNTKIGLALSSNVNHTANARILNPSLDDVSNTPIASVITPRGTTIYGSNDSNGEKKMELRIFFTEPK